MEETQVSDLGNWVKSLTKIMNKGSVNSESKRIRTLRTLEIGHKDLEIGFWLYKGNLQAFCTAWASQSYN